MTRIKRSKTAKKGVYRIFACKKISCHHILCHQLL